MNVKKAIIVGAGPAGLTAACELLHKTKIKPIIYEMSGDTDEKALEIIPKRGIDLILLCPKSTEFIFYSESEQKSTFYQKLRDNIIPNWLRKVELPSDLSSSFLLFETIE